MKFSDFEIHVRSGMDDAISDGDDDSATWKTDEIARYTNEAIRDYSQYFSRECTHAITVVAGNRTYPLPPDIIQPPHQAIIDAIWQRTAYSRDHMGKSRWHPSSTESISLTGTGKGFRIWANKIILEDEPNSTDATYPIELWYYGLHATCVPAKGNDLSAFQFTVPDADQGLLFWFATSLMMDKLEAGDAFLRQYARKDDGGGRRDDSPPRKSAEYRMSRYDRGIAERLQKKRRTRLVRG